MIIKRHDSGFTIVELMVATAVFSVILLIVSAGVISFSNRYYRGVITTNTQNTTRSVVNELTQAIQFSNGEINNGIGAVGATNTVCINGKPYYFVLGRKLGNAAGEAKHVLVAYDGTCAAPSSDIASGYSLGRELLGEKMRLTQFAVTQASASSPATVTVQVAYGDDDLLCRSGLVGGSTPGSCANPSTIPSSLLADNNGNIRCRAGAGNEYCSVSTLTAQVTSRLDN